MQKKCAATFKRAPQDDIAQFEQASQRMKGAVITHTTKQEEIEEFDKPNATTTQDDYQIVYVALPFEEQNIDNPLHPVQQETMEETEVDTLNFQSETCITLSSGELCSQPLNIGKQEIEPSINVALPNIQVVTSTHKRPIEESHITEKLQTKYVTCFRTYPKEIKDLHALEDDCHKKAKAVLEREQHLTTQEIADIYDLFFCSELQASSQEILKIDADPIDPHPVYVFHSLYQCIEALKEHKSFAEGMQKREEFFQAQVVAKQKNEEQLKQSNNANVYAPDFKTAAQMQTATNSKKSAQPVQTSWLLGSKDLMPILQVSDVGGYQYNKEAFILRNKDYIPQWIFTPEGNAKEPNKCKSEILASRLNFHCKFPIPATYYAEIKGTVGSIQLIVPSPTRTDSHFLHLNEPQFEKDFQSLLIFDLLFMNVNRHEGTYLFKQVNDHYRVYGINNDRCFGWEQRPYQIRYLHYAGPFREKEFHPSLKELLSEENLKQYIKIILKDIPLKCTNWMLICALKLQTAIQKKALIKDIVEEILKEYKPEG